jgi:hypothetical protein
VAAGLGVVACCVAAPLLIGAACVALGLAGELAVAAGAVAVGIVLLMRRREA